MAVRDTFDGRKEKLYVAEEFQTSVQISKYASSRKSFTKHDYEQNRTIRLAFVFVAFCLLIRFMNNGIKKSYDFNIQRCFCNFPHKKAKNVANK